MKNALLFGAASLALLPLIAHAEAPKRLSPYDYRIKTVAYNPRDTVELDEIAGVVTQIVVSPGEKYVTHAFGEEGGWSFAHSGNHFFIRPKADLSDTNLSIVTDKRNYNLLLHYIGSEKVTKQDGTVEDKFMSQPWSSKQATLELDYTYPDEQAQKRERESTAQRVQSELANPYGAGPKNFSYAMSDAPASRSIEPLNVWDDYRFTYFRFPVNAELPTIFAIDSNNKETIVNFSVLGADHNIIAVQYTAREWRVRYGDRVVGIVNRAYNPSYGAASSGTISNTVHRVEAAETEETAQ